MALPPRVLSADLVVHERLLNVGAPRSVDSIALMPGRIPGARTVRRCIWSPGGRSDVLAALPTLPDRVFSRLMPTELVNASARAAMPRGHWPALRMRWGRPPRCLVRDHAGATP